MVNECGGVLIIGGRESCEYSSNPLIRGRRLGLYTSLGMRHPSSSANCDPGLALAIDHQNNQQISRSGQRRDMRLLSGPGKLGWVFVPVLEEKAMGEPGSVRISFHFVEQRRQQLWAGCT